MIKVKKNLLFALLAIVFILAIPLVIPQTEGFPLTEEFTGSSEGRAFLENGYPSPLQEFFSPFAAQTVSAACDPGCEETVCTRWIPGPSPACPRPGPGGGCCTRYETRCIPGCGDPPPPPTYLPPQVLGQAVCVTTGTNSWCIGSQPSLVITSSDSQGFSVSITGSNPDFSCTNSCNVDIPVGSGTASFTAIAAVSGLSDSDSTVWKYDPTNPTLSITVTGSTAPSGWYLIAPTVSATYADDVSGVASIQYQIDSGGWVAGASVVVPDGPHVVTFTVTDNAGNATTQSTSLLNVDTTPPDFSISVNGTSGTDGWIISTPTVSISPTDAASGVSTAQYQIDGDAWMSGTETLFLTDGLHTVNFTVTDVAGNTGTQTSTVNVDATAPSLPISINGTLGNNDWYTSNVDVTSNPTDTTSGILSTTRRSNDGTSSSGATYINGAWTFGTTVNLPDDGYYSADFQTSDNAGNSTSASTTTIRVIKIDKTIPLVSLTSPLSGILVQGQIRMSGTMSDLMSGIDKVTIEFVPRSLSLSPTTATATLDTGTGEWIYDWYSEAMKDGEYTLKVTSIDKAGNISQVSSIFVEVRNKVYWWTGPLFFGAAPTPTATVTLVPTPTVMATVTTMPSPTLGVITPEVRSTIVASSNSGGEVVVPEKPARTTPSFLTKNHFNNWQGLTLALSLFGVFSLSALVDRRPSALKKTALIFKHVKSQNREE